MSNVENTLNERGKRYGDFTDRAAIVDALITILSGLPVHIQTAPVEHDAATVVVPITNFDKLDPVKKQAIRMICDKLARIVAPDGDPEYRDHWHDIQGYAKLAEDRCKDGDADKQAELDLAEYPIAEKAMAWPGLPTYRGNKGPAFPQQPSELDPEDGA